MSASPGPGQQHQQAGPSGQNQPGWIGQQGSASSQGVSPMTHGGPPLPARPAQNIQPSPQHHPPGQWQQNNLGPQRPGSTQHMTGQITNQISPSMSNQFPSNQLPTQSGQNIPQIPLPPPLDKAKFEESYAAFRRSRPIKQDERLMRVDNRPIDLHALHYNVLSEGGIKKARFPILPLVTTLVLTKCCRSRQGKCGLSLVLEWVLFNFQEQIRNLPRLGPASHNSCNIFTPNA
jgi:hypothetical protein